eukprot:817788-Alexandrium_andersonii.AAC.1
MALGPRCSTTTRAGLARSSGCGAVARGTRRRQLPLASTTAPALWPPRRGPLRWPSSCCCTL